MTSIEISQNVKYIDLQTFYGCSSLTSVVIPNNVVSIYNGAFYGCSKLKSLTLGTGLRNIYKYYQNYNYGAFEQCKELTDVYCLAENVPNTDIEAFKESMIEYVTLHVPANSIYDYKATEPWSGFKNIVALEGTDINKCEKPTISYKNGHLSFHSATEEAEYIYEITDSDIKKGYDAEIQLCVTYHISVYATKSGYENSDIATATLCWIDTEPVKEGITDSGTDGVYQVKSYAVLIQSHDGVVTISGIDDGTTVSVYSVSGQAISAAKAYGNQLTMTTNLKKGDVAIIKIGEKSVKTVMQ